MKEQIQEIVKEIESLKENIKLSNNNISENCKDIDHNTGAVALLHTLNANSNKYFIIWIITFMAFLGSIGYIIYLNGEYTKVETIDAEEVEQTNEGGGDNNYTRAGGDINGYTKD